MPEVHKLLCRHHVINPFKASWRQWYDMKLIFVLHVKVMHFILTYCMVLCELWVRRRVHCPKPLSDHCTVLCGLTSRGHEECKLRYLKREVLASEGGFNRGCWEFVKVYVISQVLGEPSQEYEKGAWKESFNPPEQPYGWLIRMSGGEWERKGVEWSRQCYWFIIASVPWPLSQSLLSSETHDFSLRPFCLHLPQLMSSARLGEIITGMTLQSAIDTLVWT